MNFIWNVENCCGWINKFLRSENWLQFATPRTIERIPDIWLADRKLKLYGIVETIETRNNGFEVEWAVGYEKATRKMVPRSLTNGHKRNRVKTSKSCSQALSTRSCNKTKYAKVGLTANKVKREETSRTNIILPSSTSSTTIPKKIVLTWPRRK